jgi:hypothetical protein
MRFPKVFLPVLFSLVIFASTSYAQDPDPLNAGIQAYNNSEFKLAIEKLSAALNRKEHLLRKEIAECHRYLAMSYLAFDDEVKAREEFLDALRNNPDLDFDPVATSPKILEAFRKAREIYREKTKGETVAQEPPRKKEVKEGGDARKIAGWTLAGVGGASLLTAGATYGLMWDSAAKYNAENKSKSRADRFEKQTYLYRDVSAATGAAGIVMTGIGAALLLTGKPEAATLEIKNHRFVVLPGPGVGFAIGTGF